MIKVFTFSLLIITGTLLIYDSIAVRALVLRVFDQNILLVAEEIERQNVDNPDDPILRIWREIYFLKGSYRISRFSGLELKSCLGFLLLIIGVRLGYKWTTKRNGT